MCESSDCLGVTRSFAVGAVNRMEQDFASTNICFEIEQVECVNNHEWYEYDELDFYSHYES